VATEVVRGSGAKPQVALTFHGAGDVAITKQVVSILDQYKAKITVMCVGSWLAQTPDGARILRDHGHELGNHTYSHPALYKFKPAPMLSEIEKCRDQLVTVSGSPGAFFRQSQGQHATPEELMEAGKAGYQRALSYDIDADDWEDPGAAAIRKNVLAATAGSVVSVHLGHPETVTALPLILQDLAGRGLTPVTASELLKG
jgi:peptidoglycan/xylan/chitin deacetylase (PgdA/CDA1 family)